MDGGSRHILAGRRVQRLMHTFVKVHRLNETSKRAIVNLKLGFILYHNT